MRQPPLPSAHPAAQAPSLPALLTCSVHLGPPQPGEHGVTAGRRDPHRDLGPQKHLGAPGTGGLRLSLYVSALCCQRPLFRLRWVPGPEATKGGGQGSGAGQRWQGRVTRELAHSCTSVQLTALVSTQLHRPHVQSAAPAPPPPLCPRSRPQNSAQGAGNAHRVRRLQAPRRRALPTYSPQGLQASGQPEM